MVPCTLFSFPEAVDDRVVRLTSLWTMIIAILCAVFYDHIQVGAGLGMCSPVKQA